jgi:riboflavin kinase/FMN adenylyltransferase
MEVVRGWTDVPRHLKGASIAIGNFDGVHLGHKAVLNNAKHYALRLGAPSGAMIFEPHPRKFFQPSKPLFQLTSLEKKLALLEAEGCSFTALLPFDRTLAELSADDFIREVLVEAYAVRHVTVGFNFYFGRGRGGNPSSLAKAGTDFGFGVTIMAPTGGEGEIYSSTRVRELLAEGDVAAAADILGRYWSVTGVVESGAGRGHGLGFPTANIRLDAGVSLRHGIYAVFAKTGDRILKGAAYLGTRPTFDAGLPVLETFLFDFDGDLYGSMVEIFFVAFVREDAKFKSADALIAQMQADCASARRMLDEVDLSKRRL